MALWSYQGEPVLNEINNVGGEVAEDFYRRLYEVLQARAVKSTLTDL